MYASAGSGAAASAIWLDNHSLQQIARLALPTNICHAWTDFGLSKAIASTTCGSVFTFPVHPQVQSCSYWLLHALQNPTCNIQVAASCLCFNSFDALIVRALCKRD